mmetsp:Transcript_37884/g.57127  ORF Transcript_37884/g.57127 Transcript_37884/m.57127 type:complete len:95 (-) Transcript_37884:149-433(-)
MRPTRPDLTIPTDDRTIPVFTFFVMYVGSEFFVGSLRMKFSKLAAAGSGCRSPTVAPKVTVPARQPAHLLRCSLALLSAGAFDCGCQRSRCPLV